MSIVIELQREALDSKSDILLLLRKSLLISKKLKLVDFETWVNCELNGYMTKANDIPDYREVRGNLQARNPYRGWIPVILPNAKMESQFCNWKLPDSMPTILSILEAGNESFQLSLNASIIAYLNEHSQFPTDYRLAVPIGALRNIVEQVKTKILSWSLLLEENNILGENLTFSDTERQTAITVPAITNYISNFYGEVENSQIQQGVKSSTQQS